MILRGNLGPSASDLWEEGLKNNLERVAETKGLQALMYVIYPHKLKGSSKFNVPITNVCPAYTKAIEYVDHVQGQINYRTLHSSTYKLFSLSPVTQQQHIPLRTE